jgi:hypothetical protein
MHFGGGLFVGFADHPKKVIERTLGGRPIASSAAGRYQFLARTWASLVLQHSFPDFSPPWQDAGAVALIAGRGALQDVRAGRLDAAVKKLAPEWASLPGAPYGQPVKSMEFVRAFYLRAGGRLDAGAPIEARTAPPAPSEPLPPQPTVTEPPAARLESPFMAPVLAALLPSIVGLIPELAKLFGSGTEVSTRNVRAAERVADIIVTATQAPNLQAAVEQIQSDPDARTAARLAVQTAWFEFAEAGGGGIDGARKANAAMLAHEDWRSVVFAASIAVLAVLIVGGGGYMMWALIRDPATPPDQRGMLIGAIVATLSAVVSYFFGSSASSRSKDAALVRELGQR